MRSLRYLLIPVIATIVCAASCVPVRAQVPGVVSLPTASARPSLYVTAPILIDGATVLRVATLAQPPPGAAPIETRVFLINSAIAQLLAVDPDRNTTEYDPATFKVATEQQGGEYVLVATDERHHNPLPILTVTTDDARSQKLAVGELAQQWQAGLQQAIVSALARRQPAEIHRNAALIVYGSVALVVLTLLGFLATRLRPTGAVARSTPWVLLLLWLGAITYALTLFPQTVALGRQLLRLEWRVAIVWIGAILIERVLSIATHQAVRGWASFGMSANEQARSLLRVPTMSKALVGFERIFVFFVALLLTLTALDIPIASVVTIGGIAAVAIGFAAQSLVRDLLNGVLVLFEDQYVEGDFIAIGDFNGVVEHLTLRVVQLRDSTGNLITIPHSTVSQVVNSSRNWSRIDYKITVDVKADVRKAIEVVRATLEALKDDEAWRDAVIDPIEWIGVDGLSSGGTTLRFVMRTAPLRQFELRREINLRISDALGKAGILLGSNTVPQVVVQPVASPDPS